MSLANVFTDRLILIPVTYKIIKELVKGNIEEVEELGIKTNGKWPRQDTMDILTFVNKAFEKCEEATGFEFWMIVIKENKFVIGDIGFKGIPDEDGEVEIGYGLIEEEQGKGYGFEALKTMIAWAFSQETVNSVKAECLIDNAPSIRILEKSGMKEIKRDNELIYWKTSKGTVKSSQKC